MNLQLLLSNHNKQCLSCIRSTNCELQKLCNEYGVDENYFTGEKTESTIDDSSLSIVRDNSKCVLCRRCVAACNGLQNIGVIGSNDRGFDTHIGSAFEVKLADTTCINCASVLSFAP